MNYGQIITDMLYSALAEEERFLAAAPTRDLAQPSVRTYFESWLQYLIFRRSLTVETCPAVALEWDRIDVLFLSANGIRLAAFELKGPFSVPVKSERLPKILADFDKQRIGAANDPATEHYVVLIPFGEPADISKWLDSSLVSALGSQYPDVELCGQIVSRDVPLNHKDQVLRVAVLRVASREQSAQAAEA